MPKISRNSILIIPPLVKIRFHMILNLPYIPKMSITELVKEDVFTIKTLNNLRKVNKLIKFYQFMKVLLKIVLLRLGVL